MMWQEKVNKQFKKNEAPIVLELLNKFEKYAVGEAILYLSKGDLNLLRQYVKLAARKSEDLIHAHSIQVKLEERNSNKSKPPIQNPWKQNSEDIDDLLIPIKQFMMAIHTCDFGCCGIGGMSLDPEIMKKALKNENAPELLKAILEIQLEIRQLTKPVVSGRFINAFLYKNEMLDILTKMRNCINSEIQNSEK